MKKPGPFTYLIGNPASALTIFVAGCVLLYQWWHGQVNDAVPIVAVLTMITAVNANQKLTQYGNWKRAWDTMGGSTSKPPRRWPRVLIGVLVWTIMILWLAGLDYRKPSSTVAVVSFTAATMLLLGKTLYRRRRQPRPAKQGRAPADMPVAISLPVPRQSPGPQQLYQGLPDYCARLSGGR